MSPRLRAALVGLVLSLVMSCLGGCSSGSGSPAPAAGNGALPPPAAVPVSLAVAPADTTVAKGTSRALKATLGMSDGTSQDVTQAATWTSSAPSVAAVSNDAPTRGVTSGAALGTATVTAAYSGLSASSTVTVTAATLASIAITPADSSVAVRATRQLAATGTFSDATTQDLTNQVTWASSGAAATVSSTGNATGVSVGTVTISATMSGVSGSTSLKVTPAPSFTGTWIEMGPKPLYMSSQLVGNQTGRLTALLPVGVNTLLVGSGSGGVWRTTDNGRSRSPLTDGQDSLVIGALARDPNHPAVILAGTGEANNSAASADTTNFTRIRCGIGILRSSDGGGTWSLLPGSAVLARMGISRVAFDPQDTTSQRIFVSTCRATYGGGGLPFGLYLSANGGQTFVSQSTGAAGKLPLNKPVMDVCFQPGNSQVMLATVLDAGAQSGVWRSADGGATWAPVLVAAAYGRTSLAAAPSSPGIFYALVGKADMNGFEDFVRGSADGGLTWSQVCPTNSGTTYGAGLDVNIMDQSGYCQAIAVDPTVSSTIYIAGVELCRVDGINIQAPSWSAGVRLTQGFYDASGNATGGLAGSPHVDIHALGFDASNNLLVGCDGGLWRVANPTLVGAFPATPWVNMNGSDAAGRNLGVIQMYGMSLDPTATFGWAGIQDNGNGYYGSSLTWTQPSSGDGGLPVVVPTSPQTVWLTYNSGSPQISTDNGVTFNTFGSGTVYDANESATFPFLPMSTVADGQGTRLATARQTIYEVLPDGSDYVKASAAPLVTGSEVVSSVCYAPSNPDYLYVGTSLGHMFVRTQAGGAFADISAGLPGTVVSPPLIGGIAVDSNDPRSAWCTVAAYDVPHVLHTANAGATWTDVSGNLPNVPALCVASLVLDNKTYHHDPIVFVGTETGVYATQDGGASWTFAGTALPHAPVSNFYVNTAKGVLAAATYGRGGWMISLDPAVPLTLPAPKTGRVTKAFAPAAKPLPPRPKH